MNKEYLMIYAAALKYYQMGKYDEAEKLMPRLRHVLPDWPRTRLLEAYIKRGEKDYVAEVDELESMLKVMGLYTASDITPMGRARRDKESLSFAAEAWSMKGSAETMLCRPRDAVFSFRRSVLLEPDISQKLVEMSNAIFAANYAKDYSAVEFQTLYAQYRELLSLTINPMPPVFYSHDKLRIGFLSASLRRHPVAYFLWPLLHYHDHDKYLMYCYQANGNSDVVTKLLMRDTDKWRNISDMDDKRVAEVIRSDQIDILIDLDGHTSGNRLPVLEYRPATLQMSGIGYMNSTGMRNVDYFISDTSCGRDTDVNDSYFTERLMVLPQTHLCYAPLIKMPEVNYDIGENIVFGSFNNFSKVTDEMLGIWAKILERAPQSTLFLKSRHFDNEKMRSFALKRMDKQGIDPSRVKLEGFSDDYLAEYNHVDIALDTYPYTGGMTTVEALYMGVPVITRYGKRHGTCFGLSILKNCGLEELAADDAASYIERAVSLAHDRKLLCGLHSTIRGMMKSSPLMDGKRYAEAMQNQFDERI